MKRLAALFLVVATPAFAHPGHVAESAGHTHWLALAALGAAVAVVIGFVRTVARRKARSA